MKILILLALLCIVVLALYKKWRGLPEQHKQIFKVMAGVMTGASKTSARTSPRQEHYARQSTQESKSAHSAQVMRSCSTCGIYLPEQEGYQRNSQFYCCPEHAH